MRLIIPEPPKSRGKLLQFVRPESVHTGLPGMLLDDLVASHRQLHAVLERVCDLCCDAREGGGVTDVRAIAAELRIAFEQSAHVNDMVDENTHQW